MNAVNMSCAWRDRGPFIEGKAVVVPYLDGDSSVIARKLAIFRFIWGGKKRNFSWKSRFN